MTLSAATLRYGICRRIPSWHQIESPTLESLLNFRLRTTDGLFFLRHNIFTLTPRESMLRHAMHYGRLNGLEGDYVEFGVDQGNSFAMAYRFTQRFGLDKMEFYGFDSTGRTLSRAGTRKS